MSISSAPPHVSPSMPSHMRDPSHTLGDQGSGAYPILAEGQNCFIPPQPLNRKKKTTQYSALTGVNEAGFEMSMTLNDHVNAEADSQEVEMAQ